MDGVFYAGTASLIKNHAPITLASSLIAGDQHRQIMTVIYPIPKLCVKVPIEPTQELRL